MSLYTVNNVKSEFDSYKKLVKAVLEVNEDARGSDTVLYILCCVYLGAETINDMMDLNLNIITIHKTRQTIQNQEGLFKPSKKIQRAREERDDAVKDYMIESKG